MNVLLTKEMLQKDIVVDRYIDLDNCSSTCPYDEVIDLHSKLAKEYYYNSNAMSNCSYDTNDLLQASKQKIRTLLNYSDEIIYTSGATMSNNIIIQGFFKDNINKINKVISTRVEHPSIYNVINNLDDNVEKIFVGFDQNQIIDFDAIENELKKGPALVTTCLVNNTTGLIVDYKRLFNLVKSYGSFLHLDATQALAKIEFDINSCDYMSCSMHKIHGLKGAGLILKKNDAKLSPIFYGGGSDSILYPGTVNSPLFTTCSKTIELALRDYEEKKSHLKNLNTHIRNELSMLNKIAINTLQENSSDFIISASLINIGSEIILNYLELNGIIISSGSACSSKVKSKSEIILDEYNIKNSKNSIRICLHHDLTLKEVDFFLKILREGLEQL